MLVKIKNAIVLSTDNYYKTGLLSKVLSKFVEGYFDRNISFNYQLFKNDFNFIIKNRVSFHERSYDFKKQTIINFKKEINNIKFLIIEGIFAKEFSKTLNKQKFFLLELKTNKDECMNRAVQRDYKERGKERNKAKNDFLKSWDIYYSKFKNNSNNKNRNEIIITEKTNIDKVLKKIFNLNP